MAKVNGLVVLLTGDRQQLLSEYIDEGRAFAQPVPSFSHDNRLPLLCFVVTSQTITHIAYGSGGRGAGSELRKVTLEPIFPLRRAVPSEKILAGTDGALAKGLAPRLKNGGMLTEKGLQYLVETLTRLAPETAGMLSRHSEGYENLLRKLSSVTRSSLAIQKEALLTALLVAGREFDHRIVREWMPSEQPKSFLDGLESVRLHESQAILHDFQRFPDFSAMDGKVKGSVQFVSPAGDVLTVIHADKEPLEQLTGADLIYYNEAYKCFVFVQYKMLEEDGYRPDNQLDQEIQRMQQLLAASAASNPNHCDGFRIHSNPFFLKLCPRIDFAPEDIGLSKGMYIPLEYWKLLESSGQIVGKRGGKLVHFDNVGRYFTNTEFAALVTHSWVGTDPGQSGLIEAMIRDTIQSGRAILYAIKQTGNNTGRTRRI
jgi:hypothetical protein